MKWEIGIVLINKMSDSWIRQNNFDRAAAAEKFARNTHDKWGVEDARCTTGIFLFLAYKDKQMFWTTGGKAVIVRKTVSCACSCVVGRGFRVRWKVPTLAHPTVDQTSRSDNLGPI